MYLNAAQFKVVVNALATRHSIYRQLVVDVKLKKQKQQQWAYMKS